VTVSPPPILPCPKSDSDEGVGQAAKGAGEQGDSGGGADGRAGGSN
jgi:hypothetical protein